LQATPFNGAAASAEMGAMQMPLPENTAPMMTGERPFGAIEMGGLATGRTGH
jgi:hypothetical protein